MFCLQCGHNLNADAKFCPRCGAQVEEDQVAFIPEWRSQWITRRRIPVAIVAVICLIAVGAGFVAWMMRHVWRAGDVAGWTGVVNASATQKFSGVAAGGSNLQYGSSSTGKGTDSAKPNDASQFDTLFQLVLQSNQRLGSESQFLGYVQNEIGTLSNQLQILNGKIGNLSTKEDSLKSQVETLLRVEYESGDEYWLVWVRILLASNNWADLQSRLADLSVMTSHRTELLQTYESTQRQLDDEKVSAATSLEDLQIAKSTLSLEKRDYALAQTMAGQGASMRMDNLHVVLNHVWQSTIAPQLNRILTDLDASAAALPTSLPKSDVHISGTSAQISVSQNTFNGILHQNGQLRQVQFLFRNGQMIVFAKNGTHSVLMFGHFAISSDGHQADFVMDHVAVDGILVPGGMTTKWLNPYRFNLDVTRISKHLRISSLVIADQRMVLKLHLF